MVVGWSGVGGMVVALKIGPLRDVLLFDFLNACKESVLLGGRDTNTLLTFIALDLFGVGFYVFLQVILFGCDWTVLAR